MNFNSSSSSLKEQRFFNKTLNQNFPQFQSFSPENPQSIFQMDKVNNNMYRKTFNIYFWCVAFLTVIIDTKFNVIVKCQPCTIKNCLGKNCYKITDHMGYDDQICGPCPIKKDTVYTVQIDRCQSNMLGISCKTQICYYESYTENYCGKNLNYNMCMDVPEVGSTKCGKCQHVNCSHCLFNYYSQMSLNQLCYKPGCGAFENISFHVSRCENSVDFYGFQCDCCLNEIEGMYKIYWCTDNFKVFNNSKFYQYSTKLLQQVGKSQIKINGNSQNLLIFIGSVIFLGLLY